MGSEKIEKILLKNEINVILKNCKKELICDDIVEHYQDRILSYNDPDLAYWFAMLFKNCDVERFSKLIIDSKDVKYNYDFAKYLNNTDIESYEKVILESNDEEYIKKINILKKQLKEQEDIKKREYKPKKGN